MATKTDKSMASAMPLMVLREVLLLLMELQEVEETDQLDPLTALITATRNCRRLLKTTQRILSVSLEVLLLLSAGESKGASLKRESVSSKFGAVN